MRPPVDYLLYASHNSYITLFHMSYWWLRKIIRNQAIEIYKRGISDNPLKIFRSGLSSVSSQS
jgi:hypothetical protein